MNPKYNPQCKRNKEKYGEKKTQIKTHRQRAYNNYKQTTNKSKEACRLSQYLQFFYRIYTYLTGGVQQHFGLFFLAHIFNGANATFIQLDKIYDEYNHKLFIIPWTARYDLASYLFGTHSSHLQLLMLFNSYLERNVGARKWFGSLIKACLRLYA